MERTCRATANCPYPCQSSPKNPVASAVLSGLIRRCTKLCAETAHATAQVATRDRFQLMDLLTLTEIRRATHNGTVPARVHVQVEGATPKLTREQQPYRSE